MGDVFDAMNRARREKGAEPTQADAGNEPAAGEPGGRSQGNRGSSPDGEAPGLPIEQVRATAIEEQPPPPTPAGGDLVLPPVALTPSSKQDADDASEEAEPPLDDVEAISTHAPVAADGEPSNGYATQIVVHHDRGSALTEQYRAIRTQILARGRNRKLHSHVITSSSPGEGKSVSTVNMGIVFSELRNQRTLLVECDLRRPTFDKLFDQQYDTGMLQLLRGEVENIEDAVQQTVYPNLQVIPAGGRDHINSTELLSSPRMAQIMDRLTDKYDHVFFDSPPVVTVTDAAILGAMCDETLLVVRLYKTPVEVVDRAKRLLRANNCEVTGVILTHMKVHMPRYFYRYGYSYSYSSGGTYRYK